MHSFDPSIGLEEFKKTDNIHFYPIGLSDSNREITTEKNQIWKVKNLMKLPYIEIIQ